MPANTRPHAPITDVYFFGTCVIDQFHPEAGLDAISLLQDQGIRVHFPQAQTCCGQPAYTSGFVAEARSVARQQLDLFPEQWPIVIPSGSCGGMIKHHYPKLFADEPETLPRAQEIAERVYEFTDFLVNVLKFTPKDRGTPCSVTLHTSCSARREMNTHLSSRTLLGQLAQVTVVTQDHEAECCGFGGTFSIKQPEISGAMVADKVQSLKNTGAEQVVSADCGCLLNILGHARWLDQQTGAPSDSLPGEHIASFLRRRLGKGESA